MRIDVKGRKVPVTDELRQRVERRFEKIGKQVPPMAELEVELSEEQHEQPESQVVHATLHLKGVTLRARESATTMTHAINECADDLGRQVKKRAEKKRGRRATAKPPAAAAT